MKNTIGLVPDIPKIYTAVAEWLACMIYIFLYRKDHGLPYFYMGKDWKKAIVSLGALSVLQIILGKAPLVLWLPGMTLAVGIMFCFLRTMCDISKRAAGYWLAVVFVLAEMTAALEWQIYYFFAGEEMRYIIGKSVLCMIFIYATVFGGVFYFETKRKHHWEEITGREMITAAVISLIAFCMSNMSYVFSDTPFSSSLAKEAFNIRTMTEIGGLAILLAYQRQCCEHHMQMELEAVNTVLKTRYAQYRQSRESIELINHKYHDLKHQLEILRNESDIKKKNDYLDEIANGIRQYEAQYKTKNSVLDTILTGKGMFCSQHGITLTCVADGSLLDGISVMDTCTIFGNALDNAIECELLIEPEEKRLIHLSVSEMNQFVLVRIENYLEDNLKFVNGLPVTTKGSNKDHGFGLKSMQYLAKKYGGTMGVDVEQNWFVLKIMLPLRK